MSDAFEKRKKAQEWALKVVEGVNNDPRPFVKCKESRPITDIKDLLNSSGELFADNIMYLQKWNPKGEYEPITYREGLADVNGLGTSLFAKGLKGKRVAVIGPNLSLIHI